LVALALVGCVESGPASGPPLAFDENTSPLSGKYSGSDAGYLVMTLAARSDTSYTAYDMAFRTKDGSARGSVWWGQTNMFDRRKLDIDDGQEKAIVDVRRLPPGDYEIVNFDVDLVGGVARSTWRSKKDFSIPFTIAPGRATYVGEFLAVRINGKNFFGMTVPNGAYFVLADKAEREIALAKQKEPGIAEVTSAVGDPKIIGNPLISDHIYSP